MMEKTAWMENNCIWKKNIIAEKNKQKWSVIILYRLPKTESCVIMMGQHPYNDKKGIKLGPISNTPGCWGIEAVHKYSHFLVCFCIKCIMDSNQTNQCMMYTKTTPGSVANNLWPGV